MPSSTRWRLYITANNDSTNVAIAEVQMRTSAGGADQCTGGTASASGNIGANYVAAKAFDDTATTMWNDGFQSGDWLEYQFATAKDIVEYTIQARHDGFLNDSPKDWQLQYWDGAAWQTAHTVTGETNWSLSEVRTFSFGGGGGGTTDLALSQGALETVVLGDPPLQLSQAAIEVLVGQEVTLNLSQAAIEVLVPYCPPSTEGPINLTDPYVYREYQTFLRFSSGGTDYAWGTVAEYREGAWHEGLISDWPEPTDAFRDEFSLASEDRVSLEVADPDGDYLGLVDTLRGIEADLELVTVHVAADGTRTTLPYQRKVVIETVGRRPGTLTLELVDLDRSALEAEYPSLRYSTTEWPELYTDNIGLPISTVIGLALKVPFALVQHNAGAGPWLYAGPQTFGSPQVLTVYRDGRIVDASEYTVGSATAGGYTVLTLTFTSEQVDLQGNQMIITADLYGAEDYRNVAVEIKRLLTLAGIATDRPSFCQAALYADAESMYIDIGYVQPRTLRAILLDLLFIARAHLYRLANGDWAIVQDKPKSAVLSFDESARDMVEVTEYRKGSRAKTIKVDFRTHAAPDLYDLTYTLTRTTGAQTGEVKYLAPYVWDGVVADRLHSYLAKREDARAEAQALVHDVQIPLGSVIELTNPLLWSGVKLFIAEEIRRTADANELRLREYVADVYPYSAGTVPPGTGDGSDGGSSGGAPGDYSPDYSQTPPDAPTDLTVVSQGTTLDQDGKAQAWVKLRATPPEVNWSAMRFAVKADDTGEILLGQAEDAGDGTWTATIPGLRLARAYTAMAWAVNSNAVEGAAATFAFTSAGWDLLPAAPATITATQGTGKSIRVSWSAVSISNLKHYELQRNSVTIARLDGTEFIDQNVSYGVAYTYQVRTVDRSDNASTWTAASPITIAKNIAQPDLTDGSVGSGQLIDLNVTNPKISDSAVSTTKIQTNAVTVPAHATAAGPISVSTSTWTDLISVAVDTEGNDTSLIFSAFGFVPEQSNNEGRILRNGVDITGSLKLYEVRIGSSGDVGATASIVWRDAAPPTGTNTYKVQAREVEYSGLGTTYRNLSLMALGIKR